MQSKGSVPVAWAVMLAGGERIYDVYSLEQDARAIDEAVTGQHGVVPLYRSPTLTDAEREAIELCAAAASDPGGFRPALYQGDQIAATLRGLLERTAQIV
jgi:hypothetical protein